MSNQRIQGENILHAIAYLKRKRGSDGIAQMSPRLSFDIANIMSERWYPLDQYTEMLEIIEDMLGYEDISPAERIGYNRAKTIGFLKKEGQSPEPVQVIERVAAYWHKFNDFGVIKITNAEDKSMVIDFWDYEGHPLYCKRTAGFFTGLLENACGLEGIKMEKTMCVCNGNEHCRYEIKWK